MSDPMSVGISGSASVLGAELGGKAPPPIPKKSSRPADMVNMPSVPKTEKPTEKEIQTLKNDYMTLSECRTQEASMKKGFFGKAAVALFTKFPSFCLMFDFMRKMVTVTAQGTIAQANFNKTSEALTAKYGGEAVKNLNIGLQGQNAIKNLKEMTLASGKSSAILNESAGAEKTVELTQISAGAVAATVVASVPLDPIQERRELIVMYKTIEEEVLEIKNKENFKSDKTLQNLCNQIDEGLAKMDGFLKSDNLAKADEELSKLINSKGGLFDQALQRSNA